MTMTDGPLPSPPPPSPAMPAPRAAPTRLVLLALVVAALLFAHWGGIRGMLALWDRAPMYSYGYLVPVIAAYLAWSRRAALSRLPIRPAWWLGGATLAVWAALIVCGRLGGLQILGQLAILPAVAAAVLIAYGAAHLRTAWAAVAYLLLMIPIWDAFTEPLHLPFQNVSAAIGIRLLQAIGIPAYREETFITLPNMLIEVARACSGVNYLVAVIALGLPLGYLFLRTWWRRALLLAIAVSIAALSNGLRVALICTLAHYEIGSPLHGPFHVLHGLFVASIGHATFLVGLFWLSRREARRLPPAPTPPAAAPTAWGTGASPVSLGVLAAVFLVVGAFGQYYRPAPVRLAAALETVPVELGDWVADAFAAPPAVDWWPSADDHLARRYRTTGGQTADVYISYYSVQEQSREVLSFQNGPLHRIATRELLPLGGAPALPVNIARENLADHARAVAFWYELDGTVETAPPAVKLRTLWHALHRGRTNGTAVMVSMELSPDGSEPRQMEQLRALALQVHAALGAVLPGRAAPPAPAAAQVDGPSGSQGHS